MPRLHPDNLHVESFPTTGAAAPRFTTGSPACPVSYGGTCWISCACNTIDASCP